MAINVNRVSGKFKTHNAASRFFSKKALCNFFGSVRNEYRGKTLVAFTISSNHKTVLTDINDLVKNIITNSGVFYKFAYDTDSADGSVTYICLFSSHENATAWYLTLPDNSLVYINTSAYIVLEKNIKWAEWRD